MKKFLIVSTVSKQFHLFERVNISTLRQMGFEVHGAANFSDASSRLDDVDIVRHHISASRNPVSPKNFLAFLTLLRLFREHEFQAVHCHSPMGGLLGRVAAFLMGVRPVFYTAHGFHFHRGSSRLSWLVYFPIERLLSRLTDVLLVINSEDREIARTRMHAKKLVQVHGIGVPRRFSIFTDLDVRKSAREELGVADDSLVLISVGELYERKNHRVVLEALAASPDPHLKYFICGEGELRDSLESMARDLGLIDRVRFLGYRNDVPRLMCAADIFVHPSYREGLPVAVMEAMQAGLPCLVSSVRGNIDLVQDGLGGFTVDPDDGFGLSRAIQALKQESVRHEMGRRNQVFARDLSPEVVAAEMNEIYMSALAGR